MVMSDFMMQKSLTFKQNRSVLNIFDKEFQFKRVLNKNGDFVLLST